jgi:hypothetical protein
MSALWLCAVTTMGTGYWEGVPLARDLGGEGASNCCNLEFGAQLAQLSAELTHMAAAWTHMDPPQRLQGVEAAFCSTCGHMTSTRPPTTAPSNKNCCTPCPSQLPCLGHHKVVESRKAVKNKKTSPGGASPPQTLHALRIHSNRTILYPRWGYSVCICRCRLSPVHHQDHQEAGGGGQCPWTNRQIDRF